MEELSLCFTDEATCTSAVPTSYVDTLGIFTKWSTSRMLPALENNTCLLKTIFQWHIFIWQYMYVTSLGGAFSSILFKILCCSPEKVGMCLKDTGLLNKLKEVEKLFHSGWRPWVISVMFVFPWHFWDSEFWTVLSLHCPLQIKCQYNREEADPKSFLKVCLQAFSPGQCPVDC